MRTPSFRSSTQLRSPLFSKMTNPAYTQYFSVDSLLWRGFLYVWLLSLVNAFPVHQDVSRSLSPVEIALSIIQCCALVVEVIVLLCDVLCTRSSWPSSLARLEKFFRLPHTRLLAISVSPAAWVLMFILHLTNVVTIDYGQEDCQLETITVDPDLAGIGVRISLYATSGLVVLTAILGHFHAEPSHVAELNLFLWVSLSSILFNIVKGFTYGMHPSQKLLAAMITEGYVNCLSIGLAMKELLACRWKTLCTVVLQFLGVLGVIACLADLNKVDEKVGDDGSCACLQFQWWGSSSTCGRVSRTLWLHVCLLFLNWIYGTWFVLRHFSKYELARKARSDDKGHRAAQGTMAKSIYDSIPATASSTYIPPTMGLLASSISLEVFLQGIGHQDLNLWQTWGQSAQIVATAWMAYRWAITMQQMFDTESVERRRDILKHCANGTLIPTIGRVDKSDKTGFSWVIFKAGQIFSNHPFGPIPPRRHSDHARFRASDEGWREIVLDFRQWPDATDDQKVQLLLQGCKQGDQTLVSNLLEEAAPINECDTDGKTALRIAIDNDHENVASLLLEKGADCNIPDANGQAPLHVCCEFGQEAIAHLLLLAGASVTAADANNMWTPLHTAVRFGHAKIATRLLQSRSDPNARDKKHRTPLHIAVRIGNDQMVQILASNVDLDARDKKGKTALYLAARVEREGAAKILLQCGADRNIPDTGHGWTPLHVCARFERSFVAKLLLSGPCNTGLVDREEGKTALHIAANFGREKIVDYLLDANCELDSLDCRGRTALFWAAKDDRDCARKLIEKGANPTEGDPTNLRVLLEKYGKTTEQANNMIINRQNEEILATLKGNRS